MTSAAFTRNGSTPEVPWSLRYKLPPRVMGNIYSDVRCGECGSAMRLRKSPKYPAPFYGCVRWPSCPGTHGAHPNGYPLGIPANQALKNQRKIVHAMLEARWTRKGYRPHLAQILGIDIDMAHVALLTTDQCQAVIERLSADNFVQGGPHDPH